MIKFIVEIAPDGQDVNDKELALITQDEIYESLRDSGFNVRSVEWIENE